MPKPSKIPGYDVLIKGFATGELSDIATFQKLQKAVSDAVGILRQAGFSGSTDIIPTRRSPESPS